MNRSRRSLRIAFALAAVAAVAGPTLAADAVLVLQDGQELRGVDLVRTESGEYVLTLSTGAKVSLPVGVVQEVRLSDEGESAREPQAPSGVRVAEAEELTGASTDGRTAPLDERLGAFPERNRSKFRTAPIATEWRPTSDWSADTDVSQFNPARWYRAPIDPTWTPTSAFDAKVDVFAGRRSTFPRSLIDPTWTPRNGFPSRPADVEVVPDDGGYRPTVRFVEP